VLGHNARPTDVASSRVLLATGGPAAGRVACCNGRAKDEMSNAPSGAAMAIEIEADLMRIGEIAAGRHSILGQTAQRVGRGAAAQPLLLAATNGLIRSQHDLDQPPQANGGGVRSKRDSLYDFSSWTIESHASPPCRTNRPLRRLERRQCVAIDPFSTNWQRARRRSGRLPACGTVRGRRARD